MIIAVDGPAASGKGTVSRMLAAHYGLHYLDTGLLYRAVAHALITRGADPDDEAAAVAVAESLDGSGFDETALRARGVGEAASRIAALPGVRAALVDLQRTFAGRRPGAILDGRDIGTVICPGADVKLFVTASAEERARRRASELAERGEPCDYSQVLAEVRQRDERDSSRATAPLKPACDAHLLDTTNLDIETAFRAAVALIDAAISD